MLLLVCFAVQPLVDNEGVKKQRRDIEKKMTVHVQQVSATQDQVSEGVTDAHTQPAQVSSHVMIFKHIFPNLIYLSTLPGCIGLPCRSRGSVGMCIS
jgi:hypothetical protein